MKKTLLALIAASGLIGTANATSYNLDPTHSYVEFHINHFGYSNPSGKWYANGTLNLNESSLATSSASITIKIADIVTGLPELDKHLKGADFFDVAKYPTATFVSTKVTAGKDKQFTIQGNLTLHGITKPVTLQAQQNNFAPNPFSKLPTAGFSATTTIKRSDFGMSAYIPGLSDEVKLAVEVEASQAK